MYISQVSGERLQDHWSSGYLNTIPWTCCIIWAFIANSTLIILFLYHLVYTTLNQIVEQVVSGLDDHAKRIYTELR